MNIGLILIMTLQLFDGKKVKRKIKMKRKIKSKSVYRGKNDWRRKNKWRALWLVRHINCLGLAKFDKDRRDSYITSFRLTLKDLLYLFILFFLFLSSSFRRIQTYPSSNRTKWFIGDVRILSWNQLRDLLFSSAKHHKY